MTGRNNKKRTNEESDNFVRLRPKQGKPKYFVI